MGSKNAAICFSGYLTCQTNKTNSSWIICNTLVHIHKANPVPEDLILENNLLDENGPFLVKVDHIQGVWKSLIEYHWILGFKQAAIQSEQIFLEDTIAIGKLPFCRSYNCFYNTTFFK